jgi:hypothetical protein
MKLWTTWADYGATGEGRTVMAQITYAADEADAIKHFKDKFGDYYSLGAETKEGVIRNGYTRYLFSNNALKFVKDNQGQCNIDLHGSIHFNFS